MIASMAIHDVVDVDAEDSAVEVEGVGPVAITTYTITTRDGGRASVTLFHSKEENNDER